MAYGHAERTLAAIRLLEAETRELLARQEHLDPEQTEWLREAAESASMRLCSGGTARLTHGQAAVRWPGYGTADRSVQSLLFWSERPLVRTGRKARCRG